MKNKTITLKMLCLFAVIVIVGLCASSKPYVKVAKKTITVGKSTTVTFVPKKIKTSQVKKCTWSSSNKKIVKITTKKTKGKKKVTIKGLKPGTATIKVKCNKKTYSVKVKVKAKTQATTRKPNTEKPATTEKPTTEETTETPTFSVTTSKATNNLRYGDTVQIKASNVYYAASSKDFFSDYPCVEVSSNGVITAKYVGSTKVLVTTNKSKANAYTLGNPFTFSSSDCYYVNVTVGYDKFVPQYNDYQLKPAYDPAMKPISNYRENVFYVSNHTNTNTLYAKTENNCSNRYLTYTSKSTGEVYGFLTVEFNTVGNNTISIYEKNPTGGDTYAYSGIKFNMSALANTVTVNVVDEWEVTINEILATYPERDYSLFSKAISHIKKKFKNAYGYYWLHYEKAVYGIRGGNKDCYNNAGCYDPMGDCIGESWFYANIGNRIVAKVPELKGYEFKVEKASQGGINHHNCYMYKNGEYYAGFGAATNDEAYLLVEFNPSDTYVLKYHYYAVGSEYLEAKNNFGYIYQ